MDENNMNYTSERPKKENPFKRWTLYVTYLVTVAILVAASWLIAKDSWIMVLWVFCIPCGIVGLITWAIVRVKNRAVALGILFGTLTPFVVTFVATDGCGLLRI